MQSKVISAQLTGWCPDGFTREALKVGDVRDFGAAESGLMQAGLIEPADEPEPVKPVSVKHVEVEVASVVDTVKVEVGVVEPVEIIEPVIVKPATVLKHKKHR